MALFNQILERQLKDLASQPSITTKTITGNESGDLIVDRSDIIPLDYAVGNEAGESPKVVETEDCDPNSDPNNAKLPVLSISSRKLEVDGEIVAAPIFYINRVSFNTIAALATYTTPENINPKFRNVPWRFIIANPNNYSSDLYGCIKRLTKYGIDTEILIPRIRNLDALYLLSSAKTIIIPDYPFVSVWDSSSVSVGSNAEIEHRLAFAKMRQTIMLDEIVKAGLADKSIYETLKNNHMYTLSVEEATNRMKAFNESHQNTTSIPEVE